MLHTQEVTGSSPAVSTKTLTSSEVRVFLFSAKEKTSCLPTGNEGAQEVL